MSYDSNGNKTRHLTRVEKCEYFLLEHSIKTKHLDSRVVKFKKTAKQLDTLGRERHQKFLKLFGRK
jgi:hypothetical protein